MSCLLDHPNICLCWLSQSQRLLMRDPVRLCCCCYECFHFCLRERKCGFPVRGGSWISSALSAFILNALLINADKGYTAARLAARLTDGPKAAVAFIGRLRLETEGEEIVVCFCLVAERKGGGRKIANFN